MDFHASDLFYVYENGHLTTYPSAVRTNHFRTYLNKSKKRDSTESGQEDLGSDQWRRGCVASLFETCLDFIGNNILSVDSLIDFPDSMGEAIFKCVSEKQFFRLATDDDNRKVLQMFCAAYGVDLMTELRVSNCIVLERHIKSISSFLCLTKLDISGCNSCDKHEVLQFAGQLTELLHLSLKETCITDDGLRVFTAPLRMFARGPAKLQLLDLSYNPRITSNCGRYLRCFRDLRAVQLTGTGVQLREAERISLSLSMVLKHSEMVDFNCVCNKGWAAPIVNDWLTQEVSISFTHQASTASDVLPASSFYCKRKTNLQPTADKRLPCEIMVLLSSENIDSTVACDANSSNFVRAPSSASSNRNTTASEGKLALRKRDTCKLFDKLNETYSICKETHAWESGSQREIKSQDQSKRPDQRFVKYGLSEAASGVIGSNQSKPGKRQANILKSSLIDALNFGGD